MKNIVLDTDLGADSDDAVALALLLKAEREGLCELLAITVGTVRECAPETVATFAKFYNERKIPIGKATVALDCDRLDYYLKDIKERFNVETEAYDAVSVLRRALSESGEKVAIVAIGPLTNISALLESAPDDISPLTGVELFTEKVERLYVMGGCFKENVPQGMRVNPREWNIVQNIESAKKVVASCPTEIVFSPYEVGVAVKSIGHDRETPMWYCMKGFSDRHGETYDKAISRFSWDPVTAMAALDKPDWHFCYSALGDVTVQENGETVFTENANGKCRYISSKSDLVDIGDKLNEYIKDE